MSLAIQHPLLWRVCSSQGRTEPRAPSDQLAAGLGAARPIRFTGAPGQNRPLPARATRSVFHRLGRRPISPHRDVAFQLWPAIISRR